MKTFRVLLSMLLVALLLTACGNKGDLVRPAPTPAEPSEAPAA